jgi:hypothetical protein
MVDVHAGKFGPARHDQVDKVLEATFLIGAGKPPAVPVCQRAVAVRGKVTEQIFQPMLPYERVAF